MARTVVKSIMRSTTVLGRVFEVVQFEDGGWGIAEDGRPHPDLYWPPDRLDECVRAHNQLCARHLRDVPPPDQS